MVMMENIPFSDRFVSEDVTTWILIANRTGARIYRNGGTTEGLILLKDIPHEEGRLKDREIDTDKPGRSFSMNSSERHAMSHKLAPTDHLADQFAKELADLLEEGRTQNRYERLILVAAPSFLGRLRLALSKGTAEKVFATLAKELTHLTQRELPGHLHSVIKVA